MITRSEPAIHLDTSFLIRALVPGSVEADSLLSWLGARRVVTMSAMVWGEFLCGALDDVVIELAARLVARPLPIGSEEATVAAQLYHATGRRRGSFADCLIAATAIASGAALATTDAAFQRFASEGLELVA